MKLISHACCSRSTVELKNGSLVHLRWVHTFATYRPLNAFPAYQKSLFLQQRSNDSGLSAIDQLAFVSSLGNAKNKKVDIEPERKRKMLHLPKNTELPDHLR